MYVDIVSRNVPTLFKRKEECCGCTACYAICPKNAISMQPDEEGFLYPIIDSTRCVGCEACLKVCPIKNQKCSSISRVPIKGNHHSLELDTELCVNCNLCSRVCSDYSAVLNPASIDTHHCIECGQCMMVCPTGAIKPKSSVKTLQNLLSDHNRVFVFSVAPAVRVAFAEAFGLPAGAFDEKHLVGALRALGADYVFDVTLAADLTVMEEAAELLDRLDSGKNLPLFTSCCPAWVEYCRHFHPEFRPNLSSTKSPMGMQGATVKTYFAKSQGISPETITHVVIAPCSAKKAEIERSDMRSAGKWLGIDSIKDVDYVITTDELIDWVRLSGVDFKTLPESEFDSLLAGGSGAGLLFGASGGVMQATLRSLKVISGGETTDLTAHVWQEKDSGTLKEACVDLGSRSVRVAVVYGMKEASQLLKTIAAGEKQYDFIEVMACPNGCVGGAGQPKLDPSLAQEARGKRSAALATHGEKKAIRDSAENEMVKKLYEHFYEKPLSDLALKLLHREK